MPRLHLISTRTPMSTLERNAGGKPGPTAPPGSLLAAAVPTALPGLEAAPTLTGSSARAQAATQRFTPPRGRKPLPRRAGLSPCGPSTTSRRGLSSSTLSGPFEPEALAAVDSPFRHQAHHGACSVRPARPLLLPASKAKCSHPPPPGLPTWHSFPSRHRRVPDPPEVRL